MHINKDLANAAIFIFTGSQIDLMTTNCRLLRVTFTPMWQPFTLGLTDDSLYNAENATTRSDNVSILIEDNDTAGVVIVYSNNTSSEDGTDNGSLTVNLQSRPFDNLTVNLKVLASIQEHALQLIPSSLIFDNGSDNWSIPQQVKIVSIDDSVDEDFYGTDNQTFSLALDNITQTIGAALILTIGL